MPLAPLAQRPPLLARGEGEEGTPPTPRGEGEGGAEGAPMGRGEGEELVEGSPVTRDERRDTLGAGGELRDALVRRRRMSEHGASSLDSAARGLAGDVADGALEQVAARLALTAVPAGDLRGVASAVAAEALARAEGRLASPPR